MDLKYEYLKQRHDFHYPENLQKSIEENIADWNLAQADRLLYNLEDLFDEIESELNELLVSTAAKTTAPGLYPPH